MNILIITGIFPPDIGGPATYIPAIAESLTSVGHTVRVITLSNSIKTDRSEYKFPVVRIKRGIPKIIRVIITIFSIIRFGKRADIIYVNGLALESVMANFFLQKPIVQKVVGDLIWERARQADTTSDQLEEFQQNRYSLKVEFLKILRAYWTAKSTLLITPSLYLKKIVGSWGIPKNKIRVIYNAFPITPEINNKTSSVSVNDKTVVSVGRLVPWKGFDLLIETVSEIDGARLIIIGEGTQKEALENLIEKSGLNNRVFLTGTFSKQELFSTLKKSKVFVLNSSYEGFPHIILEAMAAGTAVVATDAGGTAEIVRNGKNGILIPVGNRKELKKGIEKILTDEPFRTILIKEGFKTIKKFSWNNLVNETEKVLRESNK